MKNTNQNTSTKPAFLLFAIGLVMVVALCGIYLPSSHWFDHANDQAPVVQTNDIETHDAPVGATSYVGVEPSVAKQQSFVQPTSDTNKLAQVAADQRIAAEKNLAAFKHATELNRTQAVTPGK